MAGGAWWEEQVPTSGLDQERHPDTLPRAAYGARPWAGNCWPRNGATGAGYPALPAARAKAERPDGRLGRWTGAVGSLSGPKPPILHRRLGSLIGPIRVGAPHVTCEALGGNVRVGQSLTHWQPSGWACGEELYAGALEWELRSSQAPPDNDVSQFKLLSLVWNLAGVIWLLVPGNSLLLQIGITVLALMVATSVQYYPVGSEDNAAIVMHYTEYCTSASLLFMGVLILYIPTPRHGR